MNAGAVVTVITAAVAVTAFLLASAVPSHDACNRTPIPRRATCQIQ